MDIAVVIKGVISLFLIMLVGVYASKKNIITPEINNGLTKILLKITVPMLIITSFNFSYNDELKTNVVKSFYYSFFALIISGVIAYVFLYPLKKKDKYILQFGNVFSNCGFIGFPIIASIYGGEGVIYTSVFNMFFTIFLWTYGLVLFTGKVTKEEIKKVMTNPAIIAVYIGVALMVLNIQLPDFIISPIKLVGDMTSPLSMIIVGVILSKVSIKEYLKDWTIYYGSFIKLILIPIGLYIISKVIKDNSMVANTMILLSAMPAAAMTSIFSENFNKDKEYASMFVFVTTLFSIITFPIIVKLIT